MQRRYKIDCCIKRDGKLYLEVREVLAISAGNAIVQINRQFAEDGVTVFDYLTATPVIIPNQGSVFDANVIPIRGKSHD